MMNIRRDVFQALADPTRRTIVLLLAAQTLSAGSIAKHFDSSRPTISKHIKILVECELLSPINKGREIYYEVNSNKMDEMGDWLKHFKQVWNSRYEKLDSVLNKLKNEDHEK